MTKAKGEGELKVNSPQGLAVLGFDAGKSTGVAEYRDGVLVHLCTLNPCDVGSFLDDVVARSAVVQVVFEDSRLQKAIFSAKHSSAKSEGARLKIGRDVGYIDGLCEWMQCECERRGIRCLGISPAEKGAKVSHSAFEHLTGWAKRCNQHERDAAVLAKPFRKGFAA